MPFLSEQVPESVMRKVGPADYFWKELGRDHSWEKANSSTWDALLKEEKKNLQLFLDLAKYDGESEV